MKVKLIGKPRVIDPGGNTIPLPGRQTWAVLVRLLMADRPIGRSTLARELFCEAADPFGALRWCLAALRRTFGRDSFQGDPVELNLPPDVEIDLHNVLELRVDDVEVAELLEGMDPSASPEFSTWLLIARERVASRIHEGLRRAAIEALARGDGDAAILCAERAVRLRPLDEGGHVLLVRALVASGKGEAALAHVEATERLFMGELGERPSPALRHAARRGLADPPPGISEAAAIAALVRRGTAALAAGATEVGLDCLTQAARRAETSGDDRCVATAFFELGAAYVHAHRGFDDEGAILLRRAADAAKSIGEDALAVASLRELGYIDALAGRRPSAAGHLAEALHLAEGDTDALAGVHAVAGFNLFDWGRHEDGLAHYERALDLARTCGNRRREAWVLGIGGWAQLQAGRPEVAERRAATCLGLCNELRWVAFEPWPRAVLAEARLAQRRHDTSTLEVLQAALALASELGDPCWEAANARAIALVQHAQGDRAAALHWLDHARARCCSVTDFYAGLLVQIVTDRMRVQIEAGDVASGVRTARELLSLAARTQADHHVGLAAETIRTHTAA